MSMKNRKKRKDCSITVFNDKAATIVLSVCIVAIVIASILFGISRCSVSPGLSNNYSVTLVVDSNGVMAKESLIVADSIVNAIQCQQHLLDDKYKHFIEQKETTQDILTYGGLLVTVALSLFGFFGFRSLESIKENSKSVAESISRDTAYSYLKKQSTSYLKNNARNIIKSRVEDLYKAEVGNVLGEQLKDSIMKDIAADKEFVSNNASLIKSKVKQIETIQQTVNVICDAIQIKGFTQGDGDENQDEVFNDDSATGSDNIFEQLGRKDQ